MRAGGLIILILSVIALGASAGRPSAVSVAAIGGGCIGIACLFGRAS